MIHSRSWISMSIVIMVILVLLHKCGSTENTQGQNVRTVKSLSESGASSDEPYYEEDHEPSTVILANGRYHRSTPSSSSTGNTNYSPFYGQSTFGAPTPVITDRTSSGSASDTSAIQFPDLSNLQPSNQSITGNSRTHGGNNAQPYQTLGIGGSAKKSKIPVSLLKKLSNENDITQIFSRFVTNVQVQDMNGQKLVVNSRGEMLNIPGTGSDSNTLHAVTESPKLASKVATTTWFTNRKLTTTPSSLHSPELLVNEPAYKNGGCVPSWEVVELPPPNDPSIYQLPRCVRLERCGGCCASDLLTCEQIGVKEVEVEVQNLKYKEETETFEHQNSMTVRMIAHRACRCNCKVKSSDCNARQTYSSDNCACTCKNQREYEYCLRQSHKLWDPNLCQCLCREILPCSSGFSFSLDTCQCARIPEILGTEDATVDRPRRRSDASNTSRRRY